MSNEPGVTTPERIGVVTFGHRSGQRGGLILMHDHRETASGSPFVWWCELPVKDSLGVSLRPVDQELFETFVRGLVGVYDLLPNGGRYMILMNKQHATTIIKRVTECMVAAFGQTNNSTSL